MTSDQRELELLRAEVADLRLRIAWHEAGVRDALQEQQRCFRDGVEAFRSAAISALGGCYDVGVESTLRRLRVDRS